MDTLQARIVQLEQENAALRALLKKHGIAYPETAENQISAIANQGSRMLQNEVTPQMASFFLFPFQRPQRRLQRPQPPKRRKNGMFSSLRSKLPAARAVWGFVRGR
mgnify:CR=1 FL=1